MFVAIRAEEAPQREPYPRRSQHDRIGQGNSGALRRYRLGRFAVLALLGALQDVVRGLDLTKLLLRLLVAVLEVRVVLLGEAAIGVADVLELDVALQAEH